MLLKDCTQIYTLGPQGTFSDEAAQKVLKTGVRVTYTSTFSEALAKCYNFCTAIYNLYFLSTELVSYLSQAMTDENADISVAHNGERLQPVFCMLKRSLMTSINQYLDNGNRKIDEWFKGHNMAIADLSNFPDSFKNFNSHQEIVIAEENDG